ncbi:MAG: ATP-binding protein [Bryobacteraceae bacterium]
MVEAEVCAKCSGTGWRHVDKDGISAVERCDCLDAQRMVTLAERAQIPPHYRNASFDNFTTRPDNPIASKALQNAMTIANSYAREYPMLERPGLMFIGDPGTGKTHLAVAVAKKLMARGFECVFFDYQDLLERIRGSYDKASGLAQREAYQTALDCEILLLDDLGAHRA